MPTPVWLYNARVANCRRSVESTSVKQRCCHSPQGKRLVEPVRPRSRRARSRLPYPLTALSASLLTELANGGYSSITAGAVPQPHRPLPALDRRPSLTPRPAALRPGSPARPRTSTGCSPPCAAGGALRLGRPLSPWAAGGALCFDRLLPALGGP